MSDTPMWVRVCSVALAAVLLLLVFYGLSQDKEKAAEEANRITAINQEVMKYRLEKSQLENQLTALEKESVYTADKSMLMVGFVLTGPSDLAYIEQMSEKYGFSPMLLLSCTNDTTAIREALESYTRPYGIALHATAFTGELAQQVTQLREQIAAQGLLDTGLIFVNGQPEDMAMQGLVSQSGLSGYMSYHDTPLSGQNSNGSVYVDYAYFKAEHYTENAISAIEERLNKCINNRAAMVCLMDMQHLNANANTKSFAERIIQTMKKYDTQYGAFSTAVDAVAELKTYNQQTARLVEENAQRREEIQTRLAEIDRQIDALLQP